MNGVNPSISRRLHNKDNTYHKKDNNMEMAKYILSILNGNMMVFMSWGSHAFYAIPNGLQFSVQGFKFKGKIRVIYNEGLDLFTVELIKRGGKTYKTFNEVYFDNLVSLIDREVEYCENYDKKVANQYSII